MTPTETLFAAWLFLLTLAAIGLLVVVVGTRVDTNKLMAAPAAKPRRKSPRSKADIPIRLVPVEPAIEKADRIDLTTPLAERVGISTFDGPVASEPAFPVAGVGGTKAESEGGAA